MQTVQLDRIVDLHLLWETMLVDYIRLTNIQIYKPNLTFTMAWISKTPGTQLQQECIRNRNHMNGHGCWVTHDLGWTHTWGHNNIYISFESSTRVNIAKNSNVTPNPTTADTHMQEHSKITRVYPMLWLTHVGLVCVNKIIKINNGLKTQNKLH